MMVEYLAPFQFLSSTQTSLSVRAQVHANAAINYIDGQAR